jgi:hypothetical protein
MSLVLSLFVARPAAAEASPSSAPNSRYSRFSQTWEANVRNECYRPNCATVQVDYRFDSECIWIHHGQWGTFTWSGGMGMKPNYV